MKRAGVLLVVGLVAACGGADGLSGDTVPEPVPLSVSIDGDWVATVLTVDGVDVTVNPPLVSMSVSGTQVTGVAACNSYGGTVGIGDDGSFALTDLAATEMACEPAAVMDVERAVLDTFAEITSFILTDELVLSSADGSTSMTLIGVETPATTVASPVGTLDGSWTAVAATVGGQDVVDLQTVTVTMSIGADRMVGSSGCNDVEVAIDVVGDTITFGARSGSEAGCSGPPQNVEQLFGAVTSGTATWAVTGDVLTLTNGDAAWSFERASDEPLRPAPTTMAPTTDPPAAFDEAGLDPAGGLDGQVIYWRKDAATASEGALLEGSLFLGANCIAVIPDDGGIVPVLWRYGTRYDEASGTVVLPSGERLAFGDRISLAGGYHGRDDVAVFSENEAVHAEVQRCTPAGFDEIFVVQ